MKTIVKESLTAILATLLFAIVLCGVYPVVIWGVSLLLFPHAANGSLIESRDRAIIGSELLGQNFAGAKYFPPRPSAAGANGYDAASSGGSNLGPTNAKLVERVKGDIAALQAENATDPIPVDLVTTSGSGLDPDISPEAAMFQVPRIAKARGIPEGSLRELVEKSTQGRFLGLVGEPRVNVLALNLALDQAAAR